MSGAGVLSWPENSVSSFWICCEKHASFQGGWKRFPFVAFNVRDEVGSGMSPPHSKPKWSLRPSLFPLIPAAYLWLPNPFH